MYGECTSGARYLNTPRLIANQAGATVWRWDNTEPFGNSMPNDDPDGDSVPFVFDLRFPGQYFDLETGLNQNYYRDYDPNIGRYTESDLIGLSGGLNTYLFVAADPLSLVDPRGLFSLGGSSSSGGSNDCQAPRLPCNVACAAVENAEERCKCEHRCRMATCGFNVRCILSSVNRQRDCIASAVGGTGRGKDERPKPRAPDDE